VTSALARPAAVGGLLACGAGILVVAALHAVHPADEINPIRRTISEYALHESAWLFNLGVLGLAAGSAAVLLALTLTGLVRPASVSGIGLLLWVAGLLAVVYFPKHDWRIGPSGTGDVHRLASLVAFVSLPAAAIALGWCWRRHPHWAGYARYTLAGAALASMFFGVIVGAVLLEPVTGVRWWRAIPLGAVERGLAVAEVLTVLTLGLWARSAVSPVMTSPAMSGTADS
jgi:hypothetical protein